MTTEYTEEVRAGSDCAPRPPDFSLLSDLELLRMKDHSWREAVRSWQDARAAIPVEPAVLRILVNSAQSAEDFYFLVRDEAKRRGL